MTTNVGDRVRRFLFTGRSKDQEDRRRETKWFLSAEGSDAFLRLPDLLIFL
jgi:hypothetical protein